MREFVCSQRTIRLEPWGENVVRVRVGKAFAPSLFERYGVWNARSACEAVETENGLTTGDLSVFYEDGGLRIVTPKGERRMTLPEADGEIKNWFNDKLNGLRPDPKRILGDEAKRSYNTTDFQTDPKAAVITFGDERFYGLGEGSFEDLLLNGKTVLNRVVYVENEIPIPFLMSSGGWAVCCNTTYWHAVDLGARRAGELCWYLTGGELDFFLFAGNGFAALLERFTAVTGRPALLPKWGYGLTFIDQYKADQFEVMRNAAQFRDLKLPCDMISLEPGWMETEYDFSTKKRWNIDKFYICDWMRKDKPGRQTFPAALLRYGYHLALWLCCNYDFTAEAENRAGNPTDFGIEPWFDHLKQFVNDGAAGFKLDPCQLVDSANEQRLYANGHGEPEMHNLMQTLYVKEMYENFTEHTGLRPMTHFCGGYTGTGKYAAATTGDSGGGYKTLVWILNLGLSGISNTTCNMNVFDSEGMHYGFFTAWAQLCSWSGFSHPWWAGDEQLERFAFYDRLRYALMPYLYSAAIEAHETGLPMVRAMPLAFDDPELYNARTQFLFGDSLLVGVFDTRIWLPAGCKWYDYWTGRCYDGGQYLPYEFPEQCGGPLFVRGGAVLAMQPERQYTACADEPALTLCVYPDGDSEAVLYEDDGHTLSANRAATRFSVHAEAARCVVTIGAREGGFDGMGEHRSYTVKLRDDRRPVRVTADGKEVSFDWADGFVVAEAGEAREVVFAFGRGV